MLLSRKVLLSLNTPLNYRIKFKENDTVNFKDWGFGTKQVVNNILTVPTSESCLVFVIYYVASKT